MKAIYKESDKFIQLKDLNAGDTCLIKGEKGVFIVQGTRDVLGNVIWVFSLETNHTHKFFLGTYVLEVTPIDVVKGIVVFEDVV